MSSDQARPFLLSLRGAVAIIWRDLTILKKGAFPFVIRTLAQPALFSFVFGYVFPHIGQTFHGSSGSFSRILLPGILGTTVVNTGVMGVALPLIREIHFNKEIEDRLMAPLPLAVVVLAKAVSGALHSFIAAVIVLPGIWVATGFHPDLSLQSPLTLIGVLIVGSLAAGTLGIAVGTSVERQNIMHIGTMVFPFTLLGCVYYPWYALSSIRWLQYLVLLNPVVYLSEGLRAALSPGVPHIPLWSVFLVLATMTVVLAFVGVRGFARRVLS